MPRRSNTIIYTCAEWWALSRKSARGSTKVQIQQTKRALSCALVVTGQDQRRLYDEYSCKSGFQEGPTLGSRLGEAPGGGWRQRIQR